jgi:hypothetical protein
MIAHPAFGFFRLGVSQQHQAHGSSVPSPKFANLSTTVDFPDAAV